MKVTKKMMIQGLLIFSICLSGVFLYGFSHAINSVLNPKEDGTLQTNETPKSEVNTNLEKLTLVGLGDSLTRGIGDESGEGYFNKTKNKLAAELNLEMAITNLAVSGATTTDLLQVLEQKGAQHSIESADIILLTIGANDLSPGMTNISIEELASFQADPQEFIVAAKEILDQLIEINPEADIYWIGLYNPFEYIEEFKDSSKFIISWNYALEQVVNDYPNAKVIPAYDLFIGKGTSYLSTDQYHPNSLGYQAIADRVSETILLDRKAGEK